MNKQIIDADTNSLTCALQTGSGSQKPHHLLGELDSSRLSFKEMRGRHQSHFPERNECKAASPYGR